MTKQPAQNTFLYIHPKNRIPALLIAAGAAAYILDQWYNLEFMYQQEKGFSSMMLASPVSGLCTCLAFILLQEAWRQKMYSTIPFILLMFGMLLTWSWGASLARVGGSVDAFIHAAKSSNTPYQLAKRDYDKAVKQMSSAEAKKIEEKETGEGPEWRKAVRTYAAAEDRKKQAAVVLASLGAPKQESTALARRAEAVLKVQAEVVDQWHPMLLVTGLLLATICFTGVGTGMLMGQAKKRIKRYLNDTEKRVVEFMEKHRRKTGVYPTYLQAAESLGVSKATVGRYFKGYRDNSGLGCE